MSSLTKRQIGIAVGVAVAAMIAVVLLAPRGGEELPAEDVVEDVTSPDATDPEAALATVPADLYFPGGGSGLHGERREVPARETVEEQIAAIIEVLIAGPEDDRYRAPLPETVTVRKVYLIDGKTVFLDLQSAEGEPPPASGSYREMLTVYSLVNTVLLNTEGAERVVLLWNGQQPVTFAGHVNTAQPLAASSRLIVSRP